MNALQSAFHKMNGIEAAISKLQASITTEMSFFDELTLNSLNIRRDDLKKIISDISEANCVDVCDYRIIPDQGDNFPIKSVAGILSNFQDMFTAIYVSIHDKKPKQRSNFRNEIRNLSELNLGYSYSGSLGLVMYLESDSFLVEKNHQDIAMETIFDLIDQTSVDGVRDIADKLGRAPLRHFYEWSRLHADNEFSAEIKWKRGELTKEQKLIQPADFKAVDALFESVSNVSATEERIRGNLIALDTSRGSFKISLDGKKAVSGTFDRNFDWKIPHEVPSRYDAVVNRRVSSPIWSDVEHVSWTLMELTKLD
jgi:hypothetical protein